MFEMSQVQTVKIVKLFIEIDQLETFLSQKNTKNTKIMRRMSLVSCYRFVKARCYLCQLLFRAQILGQQPYLCQLLFRAQI